MRVKAESLIITLIISVFLAVVCGSLILSAYYDRLFYKEYEIKNRLKENITSSINLVLADTAFYSNRNETIDLFGKGVDSVTFQTERWGIFELNIIKAFYGRFFQQSKFLSGNRLPQYMNYCLYLADHKRPVSLVGAAKLNGNVAVSKIGLKPGFIFQRSFDFDRLVQGEIHNSEESLPRLNPLQLGFLENLNQQSANLNETGGDEINLMSNDSITRSFEETPLILKFPNIGLVTSRKVQGKVIIISDSLLEIDATAQLDNIILIAPFVKFNAGFKGRVQVFAQDSLVTEENCFFDYPSSLILEKKADSPESQPYIKIGSGTVFMGSLITYSKGNEPAQTYLELNKDSKVYGIVYCKGYIALYGNVSGVVLADHLVYRHNGQYYENHLVDITLNRKDLSSSFSCADIFKDVGSKNVLQWVE